MKMVGPVLRWLCSSSWSGGGLIRNQNLLCRALSTPRSAPEPRSNVSEQQCKSDDKRLTDETQRSEDWESFKSWMLENEKSYESKKEMMHRFEIFRERLRTIEKSNRESTCGCTFGLNYYSDLPYDEVPTGYSDRTPWD